MIVYDVAVVCQVMTTTCTISIWILAFAGLEKLRLPISESFWKHTPKQRVHIPPIVEKTVEINQMNQIKSIASILGFQEGGKMKHHDFLFPPFWIISFTGTSSSSITGRTWKACQVWRRTLVFVCKSTWIWLEKCDSHAKPSKKKWKVQSLSRYGELVSFQNLINIGVHMSMWFSFSGGYCQGTEHFYVT